jgi:hypothetical protein
MTILTVGAGKQYSTISAAVAASQDGDTIQVDAGTYVNDFAAINTDITLEAVGGMVSVVATGLIPNGKAIFITNGDITINGFEFSGAAVADQNGAGIRYESGNLTLNSCYFHNNETGILGASDPTGNITITDSEFAFNGFGDGFTHNLYVNGLDTLTITNCYFHDAAIGHEIKSRAQNTIITDTRIQDEDGTASYSIDCPNGGNLTVQNCMIEQGAATDNPIIITIGEEGNVYASTSILITGNTILNDNQSSSDLAVRNNTTATAQIINNSFFGLASNQIAQGLNVQSGNQFLTTEPTLDESNPFEDLIPCFRRGTRILTENGEIPVENLAIGDMVVTASGVRPIKWIGRRAYDGRFVTGNRHILPIRIEADALADGVPARDLFVSPEHAMVIDGLFFPARTLINGATICKVEGIERLEYFHLELDGHDVILAEGAPAETFIDVGDRGMFQNATEFASLYPDAEPVAREAYETLLQRGILELPRVRTALLGRAEHLGRITSDPDLHLISDGKIIRAHAVNDRSHRFMAPEGTQMVTIASRSVVPRETEAESLDQRRLGVPVERIVMQGKGVRIEVGQDFMASLDDGFHEDEGSHAWTNGGGNLPTALLACFASDITVEVQIGETNLHYPIDPSSHLPKAVVPVKSVQPTLSARRPTSSGC